MKTLKHPACTIDWVAQLLQLHSLGRATWISQGRHPNGTIVVKKKKKSNSSQGIFPSLLHQHFFPHYQFCQIQFKHLNPLSGTAVQQCSRSNVGYQCLMACHRNRHMFKAWVRMMVTVVGHTMADTSTSGENTRLGSIIISLSELAWFRKN